MHDNSPQVDALSTSAVLVKNLLQFAKERDGQKEKKKNMYIFVNPKRQKYVDCLPYQEERETSRNSSEKRKYFLWDRYRAIKKNKQRNDNAKEGERERE